MTQSKAKTSPVGEVKEEVKQATPEAPVKEEVKEEVKQVTPEAPVKEEVKEEVADAEPVNPTTYNKFTDLKFLALSGAPLTKAQKEDLAALESELKACSGKKPVRTVRAAISNEQVLLVTGVPVPASIEDLIGEKHSLYYFGEQS